MSSRWDKFTDFGTDDRPVRRRLLRRIAAGEICGYISRHTGRPCLATPTEAGRGCYQHGGLAGRPAGKAADGPVSKQTPSQALIEILNSRVSAEDAALVEELSL